MSEKIKHWQVADFHHFNIDRSPENEEMALGVIEQLDDLADTRLAEFPPVLLSGEEENLLTHSREIAKNHYRQKLALYGQPEKGINALYSPAYVETTGHGRFGFHHPWMKQYVVEVNNERGDLFSSALSDAHEMSHKLAYQETKLHYNGNTISRISNRSGISWFQNDTHYFGGLEQALAYMDEVDVYEQIQHLFPAEAAQRKNKSRNHYRQLREMNDDPYFPFNYFSAQRLEPFIMVRETRQRDGKITQRGDMQWIQLKFHDFGQELCATLGFTFTNEDEYDYPGLVQAGRQLVETARYTKSTEILRDMANEFGQEFLYTVMCLDQHGEDIDETMYALREVQRKIGM